MPDSFFALQAQALTYTGTAPTQGVWYTIAKAANTSHDVLITSLRVIATASNSTGSFEVALTDTSGTSNNKIFKAQANGGFNPSYQIFSKDSPCYLTAATGQGNVNQIRITRTGSNIRYWVSYVKLSENTGSQTWGNMI